ncbi:acyl carrier protein [Streptomyces albus subsp. chlorinus]|nr:acyl carrier protein [Streptomyces albus subsp. chlorinus]
MDGLVREFSRRIAPAKPDEARADDRFVEDLGYDSLAMLELQFALEELFGLEPIRGEQAVRMTRVSDLTQFVRAQFEDGFGQVPDAGVIELLRTQYPGSGE